MMNIKDLKYTPVNKINSAGSLNTSRLYQNPVRVEHIISKSYKKFIR
jgi:hypothetical protein